MWGGFINSWRKKRSEKQGRKGKVYPTEYRVPKYSKERLEGLLQRTMQKNRGKHQKGKDKRALQLNWRYQGKFHSTMGTIKDRKGEKPIEAESIRNGKNTQNCTRKIFSSVQSLSHVRLVVTSWIAAHQASLIYLFKPNFSFGYLIMSFSCSSSWALS